MGASFFLPFGAGLLVGGLVAWLLFRSFFKRRHEFPAWHILAACKRSDGKIRIDVSPPASTPELELVRMHSQVFNDLPDPLPETPQGAHPHGTTSPLVQPDPGGLSGETDCVVVWCEFRVYSVRSLTTTLAPCSGSNGEVLGAARAVPAAVAEQLEAIPRAYRVSPASPTAGPGGGPAADLVGALARAPAAVLRYVPEASTPVEPFWRARGGPGPAREWALRLLHRPGGFGAVLSVVCLVGDREVRLTWVTSDWRFHTANRLLCESDEPGGPALLVRPA